ESGGDHPDRTARGGRSGRPLRQRPSRSGPAALGAGGARGDRGHGAAAADPPARRLLPLRSPPRLPRGGADPLVSEVLAALVCVAGGFVGGLVGGGGGTPFVAAWASFPA